MKTLLERNGNFFFDKNKKSRISGFLKASSKKKKNKNSYLENYQGKPLKLRSQELSFLKNILEENPKDTATNKNHNSSITRGDEKKNEKIESSVKKNASQYIAGSR